MKQKFLILDGSSLMFRAFYALPLLTAPDGTYTNAVYGFSNMLLKLLKDWEPDNIVVAFDKSRKTFRTKLYNEYKGNRDKTPDEFIMQIPLLKDLLAAWGITFIELDDYEADDIIGTLAKKYSKQGTHEIGIVTGDRDALQLIDDNIKVIFTKKGISETLVYDEDVFVKEYGFEPIKLIDLKGLMGDSSDNIPGIPGIGPKTASKLLLEYKSLEAVLENVENISANKLREKIVTNREMAVLSKKLATIECNVPLNTDEYTFSVNPDLSKLSEFCKKYNLKSIQKNIDELYAYDLFAQTEEKTKFDIKYATIDNETDLNNALSNILASNTLALSAVFEGVVPDVKVSMLSFALGENIYLLSDFELIKKLLASLNEYTGELIIYDAKNYYHVGGILSDNVFDVKLAAYIIDSESNDYSIEALAAKYSEKPYVKVSGKEECCQNVLFIGELKAKLSAKLTEQNMTELYEKIELPLVEVLTSMEKTGIFVNKQSLKEQSNDVGEKINELQREIYELAGEEFNINSTKQLGVVLFEKLKLPTIKKTKTGYSTNAEVLEELKSAHPIIEKILSYRVWTKLKSTYLDALPLLINEETDRVHTTFNQTIAATGRLSSSDPNLQNIPVRKEEGKKIRTTFEPGEGYDYFLSVDYSQIELRVLAHLSQDDNFLNAFRTGEDIHTRTAAEVFGLSSDNVPANMRRQAKAVNFGIVYGISDYGLSKDLGISRKEAGEYIEKYLQKCDGIKNFIDNTVAFARENGYVSTMFKRRRNLPSIKSSNFTQRSLAERMAMNTPVQGSAADIIKIAMIAVFRKLKEEGLRSRILLQVHDELLLEVPGDELFKVSALVKDVMENISRLSVPLEVDVNIGKNWAQAK